MKKCNYCGEELDRISLEECDSCGYLYCESCLVPNEYKSNKELIVCIPCSDIYDISRVAKEIR